MTKAEKEEYGPRFCRQIAKGRQCPGAYAKLILTFGDIFALQKIGKGKQLMRKIAEGLKIGDAITPNMEALMRTVLIIGCSHDWPKYLNSETYQNWSKDKANVVLSTIEHKPQRLCNQTLANTNTQMVVAD